MFSTLWLTSSCHSVPCFTFLLISPRVRLPFLTTKPCVALSSVSFVHLLHGSVARLALGAKWSQSQNHHALFVWLVIMPGHGSPSQLFSGLIHAQTSRDRHLTASARPSSVTHSTSEHAPSSVPGASLSQPQALQIDSIIQEAMTTNDLDPLPPCVSSMMEAADFLARTAVDNFRTLQAEIAAHRSVFKICYKAGGVFDHIVWQSYMYRLQAIHRSITAGTMTGLRAIMTQIMGWVRLGVTTPNAGRTFLAGLPLYQEKLRNLTATVEQLEHALGETQFPPHAQALRQDPQLMQEVLINLTSAGAAGNGDDQAITSGVAVWHDLADSPGLDRAIIYESIEVPQPIDTSQPEEQAFDGQDDISNWS